MTKDIQQYLTNAGFSELLEMQEQAIEYASEFDNTILYSKTGSGKTLAFLLGILRNVDFQKPGINALILAPSRELCLQIEEVFRSLKTGHKVLTCYGGHSIKLEKNSLLESPAILIGTPGRLADHIRRKNLHAIRSVEFLVIDEFDKCLEFGFDEEMGVITRQLVDLQRKMLVSATRLDEFPEYLSLKNPQILDRIKEDDVQEISEHLIKYQGDILDTLFDLLCSFGNEKSIVFCNYREVTEDVSNRINDLGLTSIHYHGGMDQDHRERALIKYRNGSSDILVCTDLGARGLDIPEVQHIVHLQYPGSRESYVHRQGRTARMSATGNSYLFSGKETEFPMYIMAPKQEYTVHPPADYPKPEWSTLYFSAGKKDKVNKIDLVGFLCKKGKLEKNQVGLITVLDRSAYVAVPRKAANGVLRAIKDEKVKGQRLKIALSH